MRIRPPAVAGMFYERSAERLRDQVARYLPADVDEPRWEPLAVVAPHAGLMYSGGVAGEMYGRVRFPSRIIIVCPNHTGAGIDGAVYASGAWKTPLGEIAIDEELSRMLIDASSTLEDDTAAHAREHSLEVQLPFLQQTSEQEIRIVPICLATSSYEETAAVGHAIAGVIGRTGERVGLIASSDLNHYENQEITLSKDMRAIDRIVALDPRGLWDTVRRERISMCGIIPTTAVLQAALDLGATSAELIRHATSGDVNGDYSAVVGYASIVIA